MALLIELRGEAEIDLYVINDFVSSNCKRIFPYHQDTHLLSLVINSSDVQKSINVIAVDLSTSLAVQSHFSLWQHNTISTDTAEIATNTSMFSPKKFYTHQSVKITDSNDTWDQLALNLKSYGCKGVYFDLLCLDVYTYFH